MLKSTDPFLRSPIIGEQAEKSGFNSAEWHTDHIPMAIGRRERSLTKKQVILKEKLRVLFVFKLSS